MRPLPPTAASLCSTLHAPPRLLRHLTLVHDIVAQLLSSLSTTFPSLTIDHDAVLFGAATHDLGKTLHPAELTSPGRLHESAGPPLLESLGIPPHLARFARTHATWPTESVELEDLLVALADNLWKGHRHDPLESRLTSHIATATHLPPWQVFQSLDTLFSQIASDADTRLAHQRASDNSLRAHFTPG